MYFYDEPTLKTGLAFYTQSNMARKKRNSQMSLDISTKGYFVVTFVCFFTSCSKKEKQSDSSQQNQAVSQAASITQTPPAPAKDSQVTQKSQTMPDTSANVSSEQKNSSPKVQRKKLVVQTGFDINKIRQEYRLGGSKSRGTVQQFINEIGSPNRTETYGNITKLHYNRKCIDSGFGSSSYQFYVNFQFGKFTGIFCDN